MTSRPFPTTRRQAMDEIRESLRNGPRSPSVDQTPAEIEGYYRNVQIGDRAAVRETQGGILVYDITDI